MEKTAPEARDSGMNKSSHLVGGGVWGLQDCRLRDLDAQLKLWETLSGQFWMSGSRGWCTQGRSAPPISVAAICRSN